MTRRKKKQVTDLVLSQHPDVVASRKFALWVKFFFDSTNKTTYMNATQSALRSYDTSNYFSAGVIGHENLKKLKNLNVAVADLQGWGIGRLMELAIKKAEKGRYEDIDKLMVRLGYFEDKPASLTQNNFNFGSIGEEIAKSRQERGLDP